MKIKYQKGFCVICFNNIYNSSTLEGIFSTNDYICLKCLNSFKVLHYQMLINKVNILFLYAYDDLLKNLIYRYKGCYDIVLKDVFLYKFKNEIRKNYKGYTIIYPPSNANEIKARGFDHILEMVSCLKMRVEDLFYKKTNYKQSEQHFKDRYKIKDIIAIKENVKIENKKYLIIDDIFTSGSTIKTIIKLLQKRKVSLENIKVIIIAKTINKN